MEPVKFAGSIATYGSNAMPQLSILKTHVPSGFLVTYSVDPLVPLADPRLTIASTNPDGQWTDFGHSKVPANVVHEAVSDLMVAGWEAYLFGEVGDVRSSFGARLKVWKRESLARPTL